MSRHTPTLPPRGPQCPPPLVLEALSAGEPAPRDVEAHLPGCEDCRTYVASLTEGAADFVRARPPERFLRQLERRQEAPQRRRWLPLLALVLPALVAVVLVAPALRVGEAPPRGNGITWKGASPLRVVALAPGAQEARTLGADSPVREGDLLRFAYEAPAAGHLLILERDGTGATSVFYPFGGERSAPVEAGEADFLGGSVRLDAAPGPEHLVAIFSPSPQEAAPLLAQLREAPGGAPGVKCADCTVTVLRLQKQP